MPIKELKHEVCFCRCGSTSFLLKVIRESTSIMLHHIKYLFQIGCVWDCQYKLLRTVTYINLVYLYRSIINISFRILLGYHIKFLRLLVLWYSFFDIHTTNSNERSLSKRLITDFWISLYLHAYVSLRKCEDN